MKASTSRRHRIAVAALATCTAMSAALTACGSGSGGNPPSTQTHQENAPQAAYDSNGNLYARDPATGNTYVWADSTWWLIDGNDLITYDNTDNLWVAVNTTSDVEYLLDPSSGILYGSGDQGQTWYQSSNGSPWQPTDQYLATPQAPQNIQPPDTNAYGDTTVSADQQAALSQEDQQMTDQQGHFDCIQNVNVVTDVTDGETPDYSGCGVLRSADADEQDRDGRPKIARRLTAGVAAVVMVLAVAWVLFVPAADPDSYSVDARERLAFPITFRYR
jgi:hypothetical protein